VNTLWRILVFLSRIGGSRKGKMTCKMTQEESSQERKCGQSTNLGGQKNCWEGKARTLARQVNLHRDCPCTWCAKVRELLAMKRATSPAPDLAPCDFWLFPTFRKMPWRDKCSLTFNTTSHEVHSSTRRAFWRRQQPLGHRQATVAVTGSFRELNCLISYEIINNELLYFRWVYFLTCSLPYQR
jgi:hypothetical protein